MYVSIYMILIVGVILYIFVSYSTTFLACQQEKVPGKFLPVSLLAGLKTVTKED